MCQVPACPARQKIAEIADRFTVINCSYDNLCDKMRACDVLHLKYFVRSDLVGSCLLFVFFDEAGMRNYMTTGRNPRKECDDPQA